MGFFKWCWTHSFLGRTTRLIADSYEYNKDKRLISDTLYGDAFKLVLKQYLKADFKKDWIGRLYGVVNPNLNEEGKYDFNNIIIEIDGDNTNNNEYVKNWVYKQLRLISRLFKIEKLYDYIDIDFKHVGPEEYDNYLIVFDIVSRKIFVDSLKKWIKKVMFLLVLALLIFIVLKFIFPIL